MRKEFAWILRCSLALPLITMGVRASGAPCLSPASDCMKLVEIDSGAKTEVYSSQPRGLVNPAIKRVVIVIHGVLRNADEYYENMIGIVQDAGHLDDTLVLAPHFKNEDDSARDDELVWSGGKWKQGDFSVAPHHQVSSFAVIDSLITDLEHSPDFPNLERIVVTGHSAGGQFVSRYSAGTAIALDGRGPRVDFIIANPSSYLYFNDQRALEGTLDHFGDVQSSECPDYNDFPYGMRGATGFLAGIAPATLIAQFSAHHVTVFVGDADQETELLDMSCGANLQGPRRYQRGVTYFNHVRQFFPTAHISLAIAPGVGHDNKLMYGSAVGCHLLFD